MFTAPVNWLDYPIFGSGESVWPSAHHFRSSPAGGPGTPRSGRPL